MKIAIIGAGLAGCEAALTLARNGIQSTIFEMRPVKTTPAHKTALPAELVCSNSLKSEHLPSAHGLLKAELLFLESTLVQIAGKSRVPAAKALAVDREVFSKNVASALKETLLVTTVTEEVSQPPSGYDFCIVAAGPLVSDSLSSWLCKTFSAEALHFYDAIAPVISSDSINMSIAFKADRWELEAEGDYLNCPFDKEQYTKFHEAIVRADEVRAREFENSTFFEACLPVEVAARRSFDALRFGPMRPVGLTDPATGRRPFAICQLRRETVAGESWGLVGFQTRLIQESQREVFRMIPGLDNAEFLRYGSIHRNTYMDSPRLLSSDLSFKKMPDIFLCGQLCGNEGYTESIATGHIAAMSVLARIKGTVFKTLPPSTALGALMRHVTASPVTPFAPSGINFGLFDSLADKIPKKMGKEFKQQKMCERALGELEMWKKAG